MDWQIDSKTKYEAMVARVPEVHRAMTRTVIGKGAEQLANERGSSIVEDQDIIKAFLKVTPQPFVTTLLGTMKAVGFDYQSCLPPKI